MSYAKAAPPRQAAATNPRLSFAVTRFIEVLPGSVLVASSVRSALRACQWRVPAAAWRKFVQAFRGVGHDDSLCLRWLSLHTGGLPVFGRRRGRAGLRDRARALPPAGAAR